MLKVKLEAKDHSPLQILCLGAHCDDIEIGCGGTILELLETRQNLSFHWIVFSSNEQRKNEALASANTILETAKWIKVEVHKYKECFFPYLGYEIKEAFEALKKIINPDIIFTHYRHDLHQDHRLISELTWNTFRDHFILEYEIPKYDGDFGIPNFFVHLSEYLCRTKVNHLLNYFKTQNHRPWFTEDLLLSILRLRGMESNAPDKYAEAFHCRKMVL